MISSLTTQLEESADWRKLARHGTQTCGLCSNMEFQSCEPLICRYGKKHEQLFWQYARHIYHWSIVV